MPSYKYRVLFPDGRIGRGKILALTKNQAIESLKSESVQPIMVKKMNDTKKYKRLNYKKMNKANEKAIEMERKKKEKKERLKQNRKKFTELTLKDLKETEFHLSDIKGLFSSVSPKDLIAFVNNFYILKKARFNNVQALQAVMDGTENSKFKDILEDVLIGVQGGQRLYAVMSEYPKVFPAMFVSFVRVGEESGTLDTALLYARDYVESSIALNKKVKSAIIPRVLQFFGILIAMFACVIIGVPLLQSVYDMFDSSATIPPATMAVLDMANWLLAYWWIVLGVIGAITGLIVFYINTPMGRYNFDKMKLTMPVVGPLLNNITLNKFFQAMLLNLRNGMRIQEALDVSKTVTKNYYFQSAIEVAKSNSIEGTSWIEPFVDKGLFKPMVAQMIEIGMKTELAEMMDKVNEYIKMEIDESVAKFVKVLPEISYLFVGVVLIAFCITVLIPVVNVYMGGFIDMPT